MKLFKKLLKLALTTSLLLISIPHTSAQGTNISIIPEVDDRFKSNYSCTIIMKQFEQLYDFGFNNTDLTSNQRFSCARKNLNSYLQSNTNFPIDCNTSNLSPNPEEFTDNDILGCSIITGRIRFSYLNRFIVYSLELLTILSGVLSLLFVILGGYYYLINSLSGSDTDKGKSYIKNAITGLVLSLSAWAIINLIQLFFTS
jgi:hypothetical protein